MIILVLLKYHQKVLLHRPGNELLNLTPDTLERLLFDDIPFLEVAQAEHDAFAQVLRDNGVEVVYLEDLMAEVLNLGEDIRDEFLRQWIKEAGIVTEKWASKIYNFMIEYAGDDNKKLVLKSMEGIKLNEVRYSKEDSLVDYMTDDTELVADPMPNLYFTRDPFACIGNGVSLNRMYSVTKSFTSVAIGLLEEEGKLELNRATMSKRQVGSSIKPLTHLSQKQG